MPTKKELLEWFKRYKKANCPAVSTLKKNELEALAKKHGFGTTTATTTAAAPRADIRAVFPAGSKKKKEKKPKPKEEAKQEEKKEMTLEGLEKELKKAQDDLQKVKDKEIPFNKIIDDTTSTAKQGQAALKQKNKLKDEKLNLIKAMGLIRKQIKEMK